MSSALSLQDLGLVRIHDRYGRSMFVKRDELDDPKRIQLRLYRRDGARLLQPHTLPSVITDLLIELQEQLPARQKAHEEAEAKRKATAAAAKARTKKGKPQPALKPAQFKPDYGEDEPDTPETTPTPSVSLKGLMVEGQTSLFSIQEDKQ